MSDDSLPLAPWGRSLYEWAGHYEALRDRGETQRMEEIDLLMVAEPRWPAVRETGRRHIDMVRNDVYLRARHGSVA